MNLDFEDLVKYIHNRTGISKEIIEQVLDTETKYLIEKEFAV